MKSEVLTVIKYKHMVTVKHNVSSQWAYKKYSNKKDIQNTVLSN